MRDRAACDQCSGTESKRNSSHLGVAGWDVGALVLDVVAAPRLGLEAVFDDRRALERG